MPIPGLPTPLVQGRRHLSGALRASSTETATESEISGLPRAGNLQGSASIAYGSCVLSSPMRDDGSTLPVRDIHPATGRGAATVHREATRGLRVSRAVINHTSPEHTGCQRAPRAGTSRSAPSSWSDTTRNTRRPPHLTDTASNWRWADTAKGYYCIASSSPAGSHLTIPRCRAVIGVCRSGSPRSRRHRLDDGARIDRARRHELREPRETHEVLRKIRAGARRKVPRPMLLDRPPWPARYAPTSRGGQCPWRSTPAIRAVQGGPGDRHTSWRISARRPNPRHCKWAMSSATTTSSRVKMVTDEDALHDKSDAAEPQMRINVGPPRRLARSSEQRLA